MLLLKRLVASGLSLLLAACFGSEPPVISARDLAVVADLQGTYWKVDSDSGIGSVTFRQVAKGTFVTKSGSDKPAPFRMVSLLPPDLYLLIDDSDNEEGKPQSFYYLMQRIRGGAWRALDFKINWIEPFASANAEYLNGIAERHGFSIEDDENPTVNGPVRNGRIPELFRDREFLAATQISLLGTYLPSHAPGKLPERIPMVTDFAASRELVLASGLPSGSALAVPAGFAGIYYRSMPNTSEALQAGRITQLADGRFLISGFGTFDVTAALLALTPDGDHFLAVARKSIEVNGKPDITDHIMLVSRLSSGWQLITLSAGLQSFEPRLSSVLQRMMAEAAGRHGISFKDSTLAGPITASNLLALFQDGQFTSGLRTEPTLWITMTSEERVRQLTSELPVPAK